MKPLNNPNACTEQALGSHLGNCVLAAPVRGFFFWLLHTRIDSYGYRTWNWHGGFMEHI